MKQSPSRCLFWLIPAALLLAGTLAVRVLDIDLRVAQSIFASGNESFPYHEGGINRFLYHAAPWPAWLIALAGVVILVRGYRTPSRREPRRAALVLILALTIGPGLVVNLGLKEHFGRSRPREVAAFGGNDSFVPVLEPRLTHHARSFPSGHAAIAYFLLTPFFVFWNRRRALAWTFLWLGLAWGTLIGYTRVIQGAHWPSDILWSCGIVYFTGWAIARTGGLLPPRAAASPPSS